MVVLGLEACRHHFVLDSREERVVILHGSQGGRPSAGLHAGKGLLALIGRGLGIAQGAGHLPVLGQVEGGDLLGLLDLLLVGLDLALELVDEGLHALVVLLVLVGGEGQLLDLALRLAQVLGGVAVAPGLGVQLGLQLADASLHLDHGLLAALEGVDLGLVGAGLGVLALGLQQLAVLLQGHGHVLLGAELIGQAGGVDHGAGSLLLGQLGLVGHLVEVGVEGVGLVLQLPLGGGHGLVLVGQIGQGLVGVAQLLLQGAAATVGLLQQGAGLLQGVLHGSGLPLGSHLLILGHGLHLGLVVNLGLGIAHLVLVLLDGALGLEGAGVGVLQSQLQVSNIGLQLLLHAHGLSLALGLGLKSGLHGLQRLGLVLLDGHELLVLLGQAALDLLSDLGQLQLGAEHLVLLLLEGGLGLLQGGLQLQLLGLQTFADFVNLVNGATSLGDLVHDVLDLVGEGLVLATDLIQLEHRLLVGRLDLEQVGGGVAGLLLADIKVVGQGVDLLLPLADHLVELLGLPLHGGVEDLSLVKRVGGLVQLGLQLALGFVHLVQLGLQVLDGALGLGEPGHGLGLVLGAPHGGVAFGLGHLAQDVVPGGGLLVQGFLGAVNLVLKVAELAQEDGPLAGLVVGQGL